MEAVKQEKKKKTIKSKKITDFSLQMRKNSYILGAMVKKNFKAQYRNSVLGVFWTVLNPLLNMIVLSLVFSRLFNRGGELGIYPVYLLCGNLIMNIMKQVTNKSLGCIVNNASLIKKVKISYAIFPVSNMFTALVNFGVAFIALLIVMLIVGQQFYWTILLTVIIVPAVTLFSLGVGFILSSMFVFFRDIKHLYEVGLTLWTYLTPIFYSAEQLGGGAITTIININPMTQYVTAFRSIIQWGVVPSATTMLICYAWAIGMLIVGYLIFNACRRKYILYI